MKDRKVIFFDVDGVLLEWAASFFKWCYDNNIASSMFGDYPIKLSELQGYALEELPQFKPMGKSFFGIMKQFIDSPDWDNLSAITLQSDLETLKNVGFELRVLGQVSAKKDRIRRAFTLSQKFGPVFTNMHFTCWRTKKPKFVRSFAAEFDCECWLVEDKPDTIKEMGAMATQTVHSIGIANRESHPYLLDDFWAMQQTGVNFEWFPDVHEFASTLVQRKYGA